MPRSPQVLNRRLEIPVTDADLEALDQARGLVPRAAFVRDLFRRAFEKKTKKK